MNLSTLQYSKSNPIHWRNREHAEKLRWKWLHNSFMSFPALAIKRERNAQSVSNIEDFLRKQKQKVA